jgi:NADP-dependent 3-hydroxy acid dehydrogenase YdfG
MNRIVLITGASSGIGAATALALAGNYKLALVGRNTERLHAVAKKISDQGGIAHPIVHDVTEVGSADAIMNEVIRRFGSLDALINNAGIFEMAHAVAVTAEHCQRLWQTNVQAPALLSKAALPHLKGNHGRWIINISSMAADASFQQCGIYSATKSALETWSRVLREEVRKDGIRVGVIAPGATASDVWPAGGTFDKSRMCRVEDVARAVKFMLDSPGTASIDRLIVAPPSGPL